MVPQIMGVQIVVEGGHQTLRGDAEEADRVDDIIGRGELQVVESFVDGAVETRAEAAELFALNRIEIGIWGTILFVELKGAERHAAASVGPHCWGEAGAGLGHMQPAHAATKTSGWHATRRTGRADAKADGQRVELPMARDEEPQEQQ